MMGGVSFRPIHGQWQNKKNEIYDDTKVILPMSFRECFGWRGPYGCRILKSISFCTYTSYVGEHGEINITNQVKSITIGYVIYILKFLRHTFI